MRHWMWIIVVLGFWGIGKGCASPQNGNEKAGSSETIGQQEKTSEAPTSSVESANEQPANEPTTVPEPSPSEPTAPVDAAGETTPEQPSTPEVIAETKPEAPKSSTTCQGLSAMSGEMNLKLRHDGVDRKYILDVPPQYDPNKPMPLVLNFHGLSSNAWQQKFLSKMSDLGKKEGFLVVYPEGRGIPQSWNAGKCCAPSNSLLKSKDVAFVGALLDELQKKLCIDKRRIYSTGMSNGAFMTFRLACEMPDRIAAFAPVAGTLLFQPCKPKRSVPILAFNGTADTLVPYQGSKILGFPSTLESMNFWAKTNACNSTPDRVFDKGDTYCNQYRQCKDNVELISCVTKDGGHTWPGGFPIPGMGKTTKVINASERMWEFFKKHSLP